MENFQTKKIYFLFLVGFLLIFIISGLVLILAEKEKEKPAAPFTQRKLGLSPTVIQTEGYLKLATVGGATSFSQNQPLTVQLLADSSGEEIVGYDVLVSFDPNQLSFVSAASVLPNFKAYSYKRKTYVALTVIKSLQSKTSSIFTGAPVVSLVFQPKTAGVVSINLSPSIGKEKTALVNPKTKRIYPQLYSLTVEIE